ncbi:helix-turn-helix, psq domain-containing protein [Hirsutella rhossiliensis]
MTLKRPRSIYTEDIMANAIIDVTKNGLSQYRAAQKYDIPQQSISDRLKGQVALADQIQPRQLLKNTVNVDEGGIMSGFGLDSLVVGSADPKRKALLKGPQRDQPMPQMLD